MVKRGTTRALSRNDCMLLVRSPRSAVLVHQVALGPRHVLAWLASAVTPRVPALSGLAAMALLGGLALGLASIEERLFGQSVLEALVLALLLGVGLRSVLPPSSVARLKAGADISAKQVLEIAVVVLGASVYFPDTLRAGPVLLGLVLAGVSATLVVSYCVGRALRLQPKLALLVAVGNSICGNSAIAAVAPVIRAERKDVVSAIGLTAITGLVLVLSLPLLISPLALTYYQYGVLAGMSVYAVPQVLAASLQVSQLSTQVATLVKLTRVLLLGPVVLIVGVLFADRATAAETPASSRRFLKLVPWFVSGFLVLATLRSLGMLPDVVAGPARDVGRLVTILAMAGLGFGVEVAAVRTVGVRVGAAVIASLVFMAGFTLLVIRVVGLQG
jgi:uncharacterized integral membrane protein (TIGR00698 family)